MARGSGSRRRLKEIRPLVRIVDTLLPDDEKIALEHFEQKILLYVEGALAEGLSLREISADLDSVHELWGFGPWGTLLEGKTLFLIANNDLAEMANEDIGW